MIPCLHFVQFVRWLFPCQVIRKLLPGHYTSVAPVSDGQVFISSSHARLGTGGWLILTGYGLPVYVLVDRSLYKRRQACLAYVSVGRPVTQPPRHRIPACRFSAPGSSPTLAFVITPDSTRSSFECLRLSTNEDFCTGTVSTLS
jgi:hypothetical protein